MEADDNRRNTFRAALRSLESQGEPDQERITLLIPPGKPISEVIGFLNEEYARSEKIQDSKRRKQEQKNLSSILSGMKNYAGIPENGLALFCRADPAEVETDRSCTVIEPPEPLTLYLYRCSTQFDLEPLQQMLVTKNVHGLLLLDLTKACWGILRGGKVKPIGNSISNIPNKQRKGGQSAARFQRLRRIAVNEFYTRVGNNASEAFLLEPDFYQRFAGVLIGGQGQTIEDFFAGHFLHHEIQQRVIGLFNVDRIDERGLLDLAMNIKGANLGIEITGEKEILNRFRHELAKTDGLAASGEENVRKNLTAGAVGTLLLSAGLRKSRRRITCQKCGHVDERTIPLEPGMTVPDILVHTCRVCAAPIIENAEVDIIEELTDLATRSGAITKILSENFEEGAQFLTENGGIGAILRYRTEF
jgi:peptide chain release factor subunit 1